MLEQLQRPTGLSLSCNLHCERWYYVLLLWALEGLHCSLKNSAPCWNHYHLNSDFVDCAVISKSLCSLARFLMRSPEWRALMSSSLCIRMWCAWGKGGGWPLSRWLLHPEMASWLRWSSPWLCGLYHQRLSWTIHLCQWLFYILS